MQSSSSALGSGMWSNVWNMAMASKELGSNRPGRMMSQTIFPRIAGSARATASALGSTPVTLV